MLTSACSVSVCRLRSTRHGIVLRMTSGNISIFWAEYVNIRQSRWLPDFFLDLLRAGRPRIRGRFCTFYLAAYCSAGHYFYGSRGLRQSPVRCLGRLRSTCWIFCEMASGRSGCTADTCTAFVYEGFEEVHTFFHAKVDLGSCSHLESGHYFLLLASGSYLFGVPASPEVYMNISMFIVMRGSTVDTSTYVSIRTRLDECSQSFCVLVDVGS